MLYVVVYRTYCTLLHLSFVLLLLYECGIKKSFFTHFNLCIQVHAKFNRDIYEYIGTYVDDLIIAAKDPHEIINVLTQKYKLQLMGTEELRYHLGSHYFRDNKHPMSEHSTLCCGMHGGQL